MLLEVRDLHVEVGGREILRGVSLGIDPGEIVVIMGPNGSGKTTLFQAIAGNPRYVVTAGDILLNGESIKDLPPEDRFAKGIFVGFQAPVAIPEVTFQQLVSAMLNKRMGRDLLAPNPSAVNEAIKLAKELGLKAELLSRGVGVGFSGGEFKRAEVLLALLAKPRVVILDEPDSGLDVDGVIAVGRALRRLAEQGVGVMVSTHYARILTHIEPKKLYVLANGRVIYEGGPSDAKRIEEAGYAQFLKQLGVEVGPEA